MPGKNEGEHATSKGTYSEADSDKMLEQSFKIAHHFDSRKVRIFSYCTLRIRIKCSYE